MIFEKIRLTEGLMIEIFFIMNFALFFFPVKFEFYISYSTRDFRFFVCQKRFDIPSKSRIRELTERLMGDMFFKDFLFFVFFFVDDEFCCYCSVKFVEICLKWFDVR